MHERCDRCGRQFDVLSIFFNGEKYFCPECAALEIVRGP